MNIVMEKGISDKGNALSRIRVIRDDITKLDVDAIVNAANRTLLGGGGVDGAIHRAAGSELLEYCRTLNGCETGEAKLSPGFLLPARYVIHTVGPVWHGGRSNEPELLANAYRNSLKIASENKFKVVAFPNISTGIYGFPKREAAEIAINTVKEFLEVNEFPNEVWFIIFDADNMNIYNHLLNR
jgi:O-acetyl-ADP-ribose deacetylase (regulator of RNase III)